jgi:hypothetical protein
MDTNLTALLSKKSDRYDKIKLEAIMKAMV